MVVTRAKRRRMARQANSSCEESKLATPPVFPLLSLPSELRSMIWKAVVADPILLYKTASTNKAPAQITAIRSVVLDLDYLQHPCNENHQSHTVREQRRKTGSLSWLRTNRQIYVEARPLVYANLSLHICNPMILAALLKRVSRLEPSVIQSLSLCLRVKLKNGDQNGVAFALGADHGGHQWAAYPACCCWWCCATRRSPQNGESMDLRFPALTEVRLRVYFTCMENQGSGRPLDRGPRDGRAQEKLLSRPNNLPPLKWRGEEGSVQSLVDHLSRQMPLRMFKGGREKRVEVRFAVNSIEHNAGNKCLHPQELCWCTFRCLDEATLPTALLTSRIRTSLLKETSTSGRGERDLQAITTMPTP